MPCHDLVCDVSDGERLDLTILECNQPAAARLVTRDSGGILQFNHTFTQSGIVHITVSGTAVTLNVTIQRKSGMKLGLQVSYKKVKQSFIHTLAIARCSVRTVYCLYFTFYSSVD